MKKIKIFNIILALIFMISACDSTYDDIYDQIDSDKTADDASYLFNSDKTESPEMYTMLAEDYEMLKGILEDMGDEYEDAASSIGYGSFSEDAEPKDLLPFFLDEKFFSYANGTEMEVTYQYYRDDNVYVDEFDDENYEEYELDDDDYIAIGTEALVEAMDEDDSTAAQSIIDNKYFKSGSQYDFLPGFIEDKYAGAGEYDYKKIDYKYNSGGTTWDRDYICYYESNEWNNLGDAHDLAPEDYDAMGDGYGEPGQHDSFTSSTTAKKYIAAFLKEIYIDVDEGDMKQVIYNYFSYDDYSTTKRMEEFVFDGTDWAEYMTTVGQASLFKFTDEGWLFVPPLKFIETTAAHTREYELVDADYELVGDGKYHNFTLPDVDLIEKLSTILKANLNDLAVGDIFKVTYVGYDGGTSTYTINLEVQLDE
ncbi:MAG: hypothetical protein PF485_01675 [Bacteroidales bacterium]|jgi:hypothetical protein|nr:hypothetical protein [Bacteroidales bacterium]